MDRINLQSQKVATMKQSLFDQGYLEGEQFKQIEELQDDGNPNFLEEAVTLYWESSDGLILSIEQALAKSPPDFQELGRYMHAFQGTNSSIGAKKVEAECCVMREYCNAKNGEGCIKALQEVKNELTTLRNKLDTIFQVARQAEGVEGAK